MQTTEPTHRSMLRLLRGLVPNRRVALHEHRRIAELQANRLRRFLDIDDCLLGSESIAGLPHVRIKHDLDLPTSGMSYWDGHTWIILLNPSEPETRQRFTLLHELHHVICHTKQTELFGAHTARNNAAAEAMADYFAAYALMPKLYVKRLFGQGIHDANQLAEQFNVSPVAMNYRLSQLGLTETNQPRRCGSHRLIRRQPRPGGRTR